MVATGIAAATASPAVSYQIGQYFKSHDAEGTPAHLLAHTILGAATAAAGNQNPLAGGLSAGTAEAAAPVISQWLYGKAPNELSAEEKSTLSNITGLLGAGTGALAGGSTENAAVGSLAGRSAVENNSVLFDDLRAEVQKPFQKGAEAARDLFPDTPVISGVILGTGAFFDGRLAEADFFAETTAGWINEDYRETAIANNDARYERFKETVEFVYSGRAKESLVNWGQRVQNGDRRAVEELAAFSTTLGMNSAIASPKAPTALRNVSTSLTRGVSSSWTGLRQYTFTGTRQLKGFGQNAANSYRLWRTRPFSQFADNARFGDAQVPSPIIRTQPASRPNLNPNGFTASFKPAPKPAATRPPTITFNQPPAASSRWNGAWNNRNWSTGVNNAKPVATNTATLRERRIFNGQEIHPNLPPPQAGWDYRPNKLNGRTHNQQYAHINGYAAEIRLANELASDGRRAVLKWGDSVGRNGNDIITVDLRTAAVELWDSKFRSAVRSGEVSPTFAEPQNLNNAIKEARDFVNRANLPPDIKAAAIQNLNAKNVTTYTVGSGRVTSSQIRRVIGGRLQD